MSMTLQTLKTQIRSGIIDTVIVAFPDPFGRLVGKRFRGEVFLERPQPFPNGLALSADEHFLFIAQSHTDDVLQVEIRDNGTAGHWEVYAQGLERVPDGLAFDIAGNLYVSCYASDNMREDRDNKSSTAISYLFWLFKTQRWIPVGESNALHEGRDTFLPGEVSRTLSDQSSLACGAGTGSRPQGVGRRGQWRQPPAVCPR